MVLRVTLVNVVAVIFMNGDRVILVNSVKGHPCEWCNKCQRLSLWILQMNLALMMLFSAFCFSAILVFSSDGCLFEPFYEHTSSDSNITWSWLFLNIIRHVINYKMVSEDSSEQPMRRKHYYVVCILSSTWFKSVWFDHLYIQGWTSGSWVWWNTDLWVQKGFLVIHTIDYQVLY